MKLRSNVYPERKKSHSDKKLIAAHNVTQARVFSLYFVNNVILWFHSRISFYYMSIIAHISAKIKFVLTFLYVYDIIYLRTGPKGDSYGKNAWRFCR